MTTSVRTKGSAPHRVLPVLGWLQVGAAAAGIGIALAAAPTAAAEPGAASTGSASSAARGTSSHATAQHRSAITPRVSAAQPGGRGLPINVTVRTVAHSRPRISAPDLVPSAPASSLAHTVLRLQNVTDVQVPAGNAVTISDPLAGIAAFLGLPGAPATSGPTIEAFPLLARLAVDDLLGGSTPPPTVTPATVITGLFREILRKDPTTQELQNYSAVWNLTGINGVVAGLYSSTEFRRTQVNTYYLELLGRPATSSEMSWGATKLIWGVPDPVFVAGLAGSPEYYASSSAGGGPNGPSPSAVSFVDLLYRTLLGATPDSTVAPRYVQQLQAGLPAGLVALQFVTANTFRQVKVLETLQVLGLSPTPVVVSKYVDNWFLYGGVAGISTLLLASGENAARIQQGQVELPDMVAAGQLEQLLLAPYDDGPTGFYALFNDFFDNPTKDVNCKSTPGSCANPDLYALLTGGGVSRGIPNGAISVREMSVPVSQLLPSQNEISLASSLGFPLGRDPDAIETAFQGGDVKVAGQLILTSEDGQYVVDGHHRWSQLFLINPFANIVAADIGYVPNPKEALLQTQVAIAAQTGYLDTQNAGADNLFTISQTSFNAQVATIIDNGKYPNGNPLAGQPTKPAVFDAFTKYLGLDGQTDDEKMVSIQNYLWGNVERMRTNNAFITDAPGRPVMPQTSRSTFQPVLGLMQGPSALTYSFPIISYLG